MSRPATSKDVNLWRYMSLGRFVWMLYEKALWLSRIDKLTDAWEMMPTEAEHDALVKAITSPPRITPDEAKRRIRHHFLSARQKCYVNCWTESKAESYAMWRVYCASSDEGVVIRTTLSRLEKSLAHSATRQAGLELVKVRYGGGKDEPRVTFNSRRFASRKRVEFKFENEHRILLDTELVDCYLGQQAWPQDRPEGLAIPWDPELHVERVRLHPGADKAFADGVKAVVASLAPKLARRVHVSRMTTKPPIDINIID